MAAENENAKSFFEATREFWGLFEAYQTVNYQDAERLREEYEAQYEAAPDGESTPFGSFSENPNKGDLIVDYRICLEHNLVRYYVKQFSREEMLLLMNMLVRGMCEQANYMTIKLADGLDVHLVDLMIKWNDTHADEEPIENNAWSSEAFRGAEHDLI